MATLPEINLSLTTRDKLVGFAFMDIVDGQNDMRPRVAQSKPSGRGWVDFVRSIRAISLLGKGFGELIRPGNSSDKLCVNWQHVPENKDYLVAYTLTLKEICRRHSDHDSNPMLLANGVYWYSPDKLFEECICKPGTLKHCDRVQVLLPPSLGPKKHPNPFGNDKGAVIFGRSKRWPWRWPVKGNPIEGDDSDSESEFRDSGFGESSSSQTGSVKERGTDSSSSDNGGCTLGLEPFEAEISGALPNTVLQNETYNGYNGMSNERRPPSPISSGSLGDRPSCPKLPKKIHYSHMTGSGNHSGSNTPNPGTLTCALQPNLSSRTKRDWERVKDITPQIFSRKRMKDGNG